MATPSEELKLKIQEVSPDLLIPNARNSRTHSSHQIKQIIESIAEFGFVNPVLIGDEYTIISGHGRVQAAKKMGFRTVPVLHLKHLTEVQRRAFGIADNRIALNAGWDLETLELEVRDLEEAEFELEVLGFTPGETDRLVKKEENAAELDENVPALRKTSVSRPGDLWILGEHKVLCGDSTQAEVFQKLMAGEKADMVFTDPPYNVAYRDRLCWTMTGFRQRKHRPPRKIINDSCGKKFEEFLTSACTLMLEYTKGAMYICMARSQMHVLQPCFQKAGGQISTCIVWIKDHFRLSFADYHPIYEMILYGWKKDSSRYWCGLRDQTDVWYFDRPKVNDLHPTMKPVPLILKAILNSSKPTDIILDPFGGSGSTLMAAEHTCRRARLLELDPFYVDVIVRRWQEDTGLPAILSGTDQEFDTVEKEREEENGGDSLPDGVG